MHTNSSLSGLIDAGDIFNVKLLHAICPKYTWQVKTKAQMTLSHNIHIVGSKHFHER